MTEQPPYPPVRRRRLDLDAMEVPCRDCEVGEPHVCPLLRYDVPYFMDANAPSTSPIEPSSTGTKGDSPPAEPS